MDEIQLKGHCYNCDDNYFIGKKCEEKNIFMGMVEDFSKEEVVVSLVHEIPPPYDLTPPSNPLEVEPLISLNSLTRFYAPLDPKINWLH
jgi:hypothetical protein